MVTTNKDAVEAPVKVAAEPIVLTLNEFCIRLSETVTRPELIGAFAYSERVAGNSRSTAEAFKARFTAFINKPV